MLTATAKFVRKPTLSLVVRRQVGTVSASDQSLSINDRDDASPVRDQSPAFEFLQRYCYARSCGAEHDCEVFVREGDFMIIEAVISQKQPACQPLFDLVAAIGEGRIRYLHHERVRVPHAGLT
jgi:hypothetical protein